MFFYLVKTLSCSFAGEFEWRERGKHNTTEFFFLLFFVNIKFVPLLMAKMVIFNGLFITIFHVKSSSAASKNETSLPSPKKETARGWNKWWRRKSPDWMRNGNEKREGGKMGKCPFMKKYALSRQKMFYPSFSPVYSLCHRNLMNRSSFWGHHAARASCDVKSLRTTRSVSAMSVCSPDSEAFWAAARRRLWLTNCRMCVLGMCDTA